MAGLDEAMGSVVSSVLGALAGSAAAGGTPTRPILRIITPGTYNPTTGTTTGSGSTDYTLTSAPPAGYKLGLIDGTSIQKGDLRVFAVAASVPQPDPAKDVVLIGGVAWKIIDVRNVYSGDSVVAYAIQIRK